MNQKTEEKGIVVERLVQSDMQYYRGKNHEMIFLLLRFIYLCLAGVGIALSLFRTFQMEIALPGLIAGVIILSLIVTVLYVLPAKWKLTVPAVLAVMLAILFLFFDSISGGLCLFVNHVLEVMSEYYHVSVDSLAVAEPTSVQQLIFILYLMAWLILALGAGIIYFLDGRIVALLVAVPLALALAVGILPDQTGMLLMVIALIGSFFLQYSKYRESFSAQSVTVQIGTTMFARLRWQIVAATAGLLLLLMPLSAGVFGPQINTEVQENSTLRADIQNGDIVRDMRSFWKKLLRLEWDWLPFDLVRSSGIYGGKLSNIREVKDYNEIHLYLDISESLYAPLYLRGYIGSSYTGEGWDELSGNQEDAARATGMGVVELNEEYYQLLAELKQSGTSAVFGRMQMVITNVDANDEYDYIPYGVTLSDNQAGAVSDAYPADSTDRQILTAYYLNNQGTEQLDLLEDYSKSSSGADAAYSAFAKEVYCEVPVEGLDQFWAEYSGRSFSSLSDCVSFVRTTLDQHAEYTKAPGATPDGEDYVEYFLYENKKGLCTHYASAAVLLFRMFGIPARYVEGYLSTSLESGEINEIMDTAAHAWPEIYLDGVGWIPIEVTPGFLNHVDSETEEETGALDQESLEDVSDAAEETQPESNAADPGLYTTAAPTTAAQTTAAGENSSPQDVSEEERRDQEEQTTAPQPQSQADPENQPDSPSVFSQVLKVLLIIAAVLVLLAAGFALLLLRRKHLLQRERQRAAGAPKAAVVSIWNRLYRLSRLQGLALDENTQLPAIGEHYPFIEAGEWRQIRAILLEAGFSGREMSEESRDRIWAFYRKFCRETATSCGRVRELFYRFLYCFW